MEWIKDLKKPLENVTEQRLLELLLELMKLVSTENSGYCLFLNLRSLI